MKKIFFLFFALFLTSNSWSQYTFPNCYQAHVAGQVYTAGQQVSLNGKNYEAAYWTDVTPPGTGWKYLSPCGNIDVNTLLGPAYQGQPKLIGYMPTWRNDTYDFTKYAPERITNVIISFLEFKMNNSDYTSNDFASIAFTQATIDDVNTVLVDKNVLSRSQQAGTKVSVAIGGALDYGFLWLMTKYYDNDSKIDEVAQLIVNYYDQTGVDGIDLDMECWWADPAINGTTDQGGRYRGGTEGKPDEGPHPAGIGLKKLAKRLKELRPNMILTGAFFSTSWYGNNYDASIIDHLDWMGVMTYDFTGSWNASPKGPHTALYDVPLNTYDGQTADNPIYSCESALKYWQGIGSSTFNYDGWLFDVPRAKLCLGSPFYGYDFSQNKPNGGNGYVAVAYKDIIAAYPDAHISYDQQNLNNRSGHINQDGRDIYYETPESIEQKYKFVENHGHQGIIIWELTQDLDPDDPKGLLYAISNAAGFSNDNVAFENQNDLYFVDDVLYFNLNSYDLDQIEIFNVIGQKIQTITIENKKKGQYKTGLNTGVYIVKSGDFTKKVIVK